MDQNHMLLQAIVENGRMGADACEQLLKKAEEKKIREELMLERQQYEESVRDAEKRLYELGFKSHPKGPMARMGMWMGMEMNTMMDHSPAHIADMLIQGATMGIVDMTKARNSYPDADAHCQGIASNLITRQQDAIDRLKAFLKEKVVVE